MKSLKDKDITDVFKKGCISEIIDALMNLEIEGFTTIYMISDQVYIMALGKSKE